MLYSFLYIDPGTGSMLFSILIALATTAAFGARVAWMKAHFIITRGKKEKTDARNRGIVIYSDDKRYWNVFGPVCREAERRGVDMVYMTQSADDKALEECKNFEHVKAEYIGEGNKGIAHMNFLVADVVLSTTPNLEVYQWKRSREVKWYVHVPHSITDLLGYRMFALDFYDAVLMSGDYPASWMRRLEKMRGEDAKELAVVGYPPIDEMAARLKSVQKDGVEAASQEDGVGEANEGASKTVSDDGAASSPVNAEGKRRTVLLAPSWGPTAILTKYGASFLRALRDTGYSVIVRPHPQSRASEGEMLDALMKEFPNADGFEWNYDTDNFECLRRADVLISDYSGTMFEFAFVFDKPVIYADATFNTDIYDSAWFEGETRWYFLAVEKFAAKLDAKDFGKMKTVLDEAVSSDAMRQRRAQVREEAWTHKGESAKCIVDYLVQKQKELLEGKNADAAVEREAV